jgi:enoyl-[acyl-carrier protein] reductase I
LAKELEAPLFAALDVQKAGQLEAVFDHIRHTWGRLDIALYSIPPPSFAWRNHIDRGVSDDARKVFPGILRGTNP